MKIIRPVNLAIIVLTQMLLRFCVVETYLGFSDITPALGTLNFSLLVMSTVVIAAGGYILNDIYDREIDASGKPDRVLPARGITAGAAWTYYWILTIPGVLTGFFLAITIEYVMLGFVFPAVAIMLWLYSARAQKQVLAGNAMVSLLSALVVLVLWLFEFFALKADPIRFVDALKQISILQVIVAGYALFAFFVSLAREIVKDIEDRESDRAGGYLTLPVVYGVNAGRRAVVAVHLLTMVLLAGAMVWLFQQHLMLVFWYLAVAVQLLLLFVLYQLVISRDPRDFHFLSNAYKLIMLAGILSMELFYISF